MSPGSQNMNTGADALGTTENEFGRSKLDKRNLTPTVPPKMSPGAQNVKTGADALSTVENESGSTKHEYGNRRLRYR
jgi:hypothetical protein